MSGDRWRCYPSAGAKEPAKKQKYSLACRVFLLAGLCLQIR